MFKSLKEYALSNLQEFVEALSHVQGLCFTSGNLAFLVDAPESESSGFQACKLKSIVSLASFFRHNQEVPPMVCHGLVGAPSISKADDKLRLFY